MNMKKLSVHLAMTSSNGKTKLLVLPANATHKAPMVMLLLEQVKGTKKTLLAAEINPNFLWGNVEDYPSNISVCAYRVADNINQRLFCSGEEHPTFKDHSLPENSGKYELFIRGEFQDQPWQFVTQRTYPFSTSL
jgi:hypothetical protein